MLKIIKSKKNKGSGLIEIVISAGIILLVLTGLYNVHVYFLKTTIRNIDALKATFLMEEGVEAVKTIRDSGWPKISSLSLNTNYHLVFVNSDWATTTTASLIDDHFDRVFSIDQVYRDVNGNIISNGGSADSGSRKLTVSVSWRNGEATTTKSVVTYITNII